jgi:hypothetical protein
MFKQAVTCISSVACLTVADLVLGAAGNNNKKKKLKEQAAEYIVL